MRWANTWVLGAAGLSIALALGACGREQSNGEGETHWLFACERDSDCGAGMCICNTCSAACAGDNDCAGEREARCFDTGSPGLSVACARDRGDVSAVCIADCDADADCGSQQACRQGACIVATQASTAATQAPTAATQAPVALPARDPREYSALAAAMAPDLTQSPGVPRPRTSFAASQEEIALLTGTFLEEPCTDWNTHEHGCMYLILEERPDGGGIRGFVALEPGGRMLNGPPPSGPFDQDPDPNVGYPAEVPDEDMGTLLQNLVPNVRYRALDPRFEGGRLTLWTSPYDLWTPWCTRQESYQVDVNGSTRFRCIPQDATPDDTDPRKWEQCREYDNPDCRAHMLSCWAPTCACDAAGCQAAVHTQPHQYVFEPDGEDLRLVRGRTPRSSLLPVKTLRRVAP